MQKKKLRNRFSNLPTLDGWHLILQKLHLVSVLLTITLYCLLPTCYMQYSLMLSILLCILLFYFKLVSQGDLQNDFTILMCIDMKFEHHWLDPLSREMDTSGCLSLLPETCCSHRSLLWCHAAPATQYFEFGLPQRSACCEGMRWLLGLGVPSELVNCLSDLGWEAGSCNSVSKKNGSLGEMESLNQSLKPVLLRVMPWTVTRSPRSTLWCLCRTASKTSSWGADSDTEEWLWEHDLNLHGTECHLFHSQKPLSALVLHLVRVLIDVPIFTQRRHWCHFSTWSFIFYCMNNCNTSPANNWNAMPFPPTPAILSLLRWYPVGLCLHALCISMITR